MRRRAFLSLVGGAALAPLAARAQQPLPVVSYLGSQSAAPLGHLIAALKEGLKQAGYVDGQNVTIETFWADDHYDRLPAMAADIVRRHVAVIVAGGGNVSPLAVKAATSTIPIVFPIVTDPVRGGLVTSLNRPGGNLTGIAALTIELDPKRMELMSEFVPSGRPIGALLDLNRPEAEEQRRGLQAAAQGVGHPLVIATVSSESEFDAAFAALVAQTIGGLVVAASPLFTGRRDHLIALSAQHALPTIYSFSDYARAGGLISYGADTVDCYRKAGGYVGRILKGEKPADLPVLQPTNFELVVNLKTAKALNITVPPSLLGLATEVIE